MRYWNKVLNLGVKGNLSPLEIRQIQTVNGLCLVALILLSALFCVNVVYVGYLAALADIIGIFLVILPTWRLNYKGHYLPARILAFYACIIMSVLLASYNILNDRPLYTEVNIIAMSPAAILFFEGRLKNFSFLFALATYIFVLLLRFTVLEDSPLYFFNIYLALFAFSMCYGLANIHKNAYIATQKIILDKNEELKVKNEEIEVQAKKLSELNELKDKFLSIISHDLRSPLNSLQSVLNLLAKDHISKEEFNTQVKLVSGNVTQTREFLDNLLHWAKNQLHGGSIKPTIVNISHLISQVVQFFQEEANNKQLKLIWEADHNIRAWGDPENILLVLRNLIANAIKFSEAENEIIIMAREQGEFIEISVKDFGIGIPEEELGKVFTNQIQSTTGTLNEKGTGLGLMLCREFVEKSGGTIEVNSTVDEGSIFSFTIPKWSFQNN
jgi:signal transduction histidine kinase